MAVASESYAPSVLVSTEGLPEKDWLEYRRRGIGGSDAAAILGISPFATARDLYYDKLKIVPFDDSESNWVAKKMGHLLEDLVAEIFHVKTGYMYLERLNAAVEAEGVFACDAGGHPPVFSAVCEGTRFLPVYTYEEAVERLENA